MTILIKGMEMPENCYLCRLGDQGLGIKCRIVGGTYANDSNKPSSRPSWCPLTEVPTPHGRLIDADALMELYEPAPGDVNEWEHYTTTVSVIRQNIKDQPTVIEAEER